MIKHVLRENRKIEPLCEVILGAFCQRIQWMVISEYGGGFEGGVWANSVVKSRKSVKGHDMCTSKEKYVINLDN